MLPALIRYSLALLILGSTACNYTSQPDYPVDPGNPGSPPATVSVDGVRLTPQSLQLPTIGATRQLVATISPLNATDQGLIWESSDPSVATVSPTGLVTAKAPGAEVFITVFTHDGHFQSSVNVTVFQ